MTNSLLTLISEVDRPLLERLMEDHPDTPKLWSLERSRTSNLQLSVQDQNLKVFEAKVDLLFSGVATLRDDIDAVLTVVLRKMKAVRRVQLFGASLATLSGLALAISSALEADVVWQKVVAAAFATIGGIVVVLSDYFEQAPSGIRIASAEEFGKLSQIDAELIRLERRAKRHSVLPLAEEDVDEMIASLDEYAMHLNRFRVA